MVEENRRLSGTLTLEGVSLTLRLGVLPAERIEARVVPVDIQWSGELFAGGKPAVDYSEVCSALKTGIKTEYQFIEELAADILSVLTAGWQGRWKVTVHKAFPPVAPSMDAASVSVSGG